MRDREHGADGCSIHSPEAAAELERHSSRACFWLNLLPGRSLERVLLRVGQPRGSKSMANHLRNRLGLDGAKAGLLRERLSPEGVCGYSTPRRGHQGAADRGTRHPRPISISSAGRHNPEVSWIPQLMPRLPGLFCAGEYSGRLQRLPAHRSCFATGYQAAAASTPGCASIPEPPGSTKRSRYWPELTRSRSQKCGSSHQVF